MQSPVSKADPNGALVRYAITSAQPIKTLEISLVGGGVSQQMTYKVQTGDSGNIFKGLAFTPSTLGTWPVQLKAWDAKNNWGTTICKPGMTVTQ